MNAGFTPHPLKCSAWIARICAGVAVGVLAFTGVAAQTTITINNPSFEAPTPTGGANYTVGATGWTQLPGAIDSGTFKPSAVPTGPTPPDGAQVGFANASGGLLQVLGTNFTSGMVYTFSADIGRRADDTSGFLTSVGAFQIGTYDGTFHVLASQSATIDSGRFDPISGTYVAAPADNGMAIAIYFTNIASAQVLFDEAHLTVSAIPEPATAAALTGVAALGLALMRRRMGEAECGVSEVVTADEAAAPRSIHRGCA